MRRTLRLTLVAALAATVGPAFAYAQQGQPVTITGRVSNEAGQPMQGATISLTGMQLGDLSDEEGRYSITVPGARATGQGATLEARRLGFRPVTVSVTLTPGSTITQNFTLESNPLQLGEVVITGAGTATEAERIGTVRTPIDSQAIQRSSEQNAIQALAAKAPGVTVTQQSGTPGASSAIRIRGLGTIQGTGQPLIVVDGTPIDNSTIATSDATGSTDVPNRAADINPNDIESVEILKSSAAAAIYGARAGQGVVLITTKSGRAGPTRYSLRSTTRFDELQTNIPLQQRWGQGAANEGVTCTNENCRPASTTWGPQLAPGTQVFDHDEELYETGMLFDNTLQVSGGNERTTFFLSGSASNHEGVFTGPNDYYNRYSVRLKASQQIGGQLQLLGNVAYVDDRGRFTQKGSNTSGVNLGAWRSPPEFDNRPYIDPETGLHRSYRFPNPSAASATLGRGYDNPFFVINEQENTQQVGRAFGNLGLNWDPAIWFSLRYNVGADYASDERLETLPQSSSGFPTGQLIRGNIVQYQIDNNLTATFTRPSEGWDTRLTLGGNINSRNFRQNFVTGQNLIAPEPFNLQNTTDYTTNEFRSLIRGQSFFAQVQQSLWDQLYLTGTIRNDGFSTFGASERRHWFPAATLAWSFTNLFNAGGFLTDGRLRAAYGVTGTEPGVYLTTGFFSSGFLTSSYGDALQASQGGVGGLFTAGRRPQNDLKPERQTEFETGVDLGFLDGRADLGVTYYNRRARDVIFDLPLAPSTGFSIQAANGGTIRNTGFEATLNLRPIQSARFDWDIGFQYTMNRSKVLELTGAEAVDLPTGGFFTGNLVSAVEGHPLGVFRSYDFVRCRYGEATNAADVNGDGEPEDVNALCRAAGAPNNAVYLAESGFPLEDPTLRVVGDPNNNWSGAVRTGLRFGNWNVSGLVDIRRGGQLWNGTKGALYHFGTHKDTEGRATCTFPEDADDYVCSGNPRIFGVNYAPGGGDPGEFRVFGPGVNKEVQIGENWFTGVGSGFGLVASQFMEDGSFVKLREISVGYTFTQPWVQRALGLTSLDVRLAGRNLATWTDYTGVDPETNLGGAEVAARGVDYFNNPQTRSFVITIGLNR